MKTKDIKLLLKGIYFLGIADGRDMMRFPHDRFLGNTEARRIYEDKMLQDSYFLLKKLIK